MNIKRTSILLRAKTQVTSNPDLYEYKLQLTQVSNNNYDAWGNGNAIHSFISIIAGNDKLFKEYLNDLQHVIVDTDACMAFDDGILQLENKETAV